MAQTERNEPVWNWSVVLRKFLIFFIVTIAAAAVVRGQAPEPAEMRVLEDMYLAKDDGSGKAGDAASDFVTSDIPIYCVVVLGSAAPVTVKMNLVAVSVAGVKDETRVVSSSYTTKDNQDRVNFTGRPEKLWIPGRYRADVFIDGTLVKKIDFEIRKRPSAVSSVLSFQPKPPPRPKSTSSKRN